MDRNTCKCNLRHSQDTCDCHNRTSNCQCNVRISLCNCVARFTNETIMDDISFKGINEYILSHGSRSSGIVYEDVFHPDKTLFNKKYEHLKVLLQSVQNEREFEELPTGNMTGANIAGYKCMNHKRDDVDSLSLRDIHKVVSNLSKCSCNARKTEGCFCQNRQFNNCECNLHNDQLKCNTREGSYCDCNGRCSCNMVSEYSVCSCVTRGTIGQPFKQRCTCNVRNDYWS